MLPLRPVPCTNTRGKQNSFIEWKLLCFGWISLKHDPNRQIQNKSQMVIAWCIGDRPLYELMIAQFNDVYVTVICASPALIC